MKATKGNKTYTISEQEEKRYVLEGFDIQDDNGNIVKYGRGKVVTYEEYQTVLNENKELKAELEALKVQKEDPFSGMSAEELKKYAAAHEIDIGNASSEAGIMKKIKEAQSTGD